MRNWTQIAALVLSALAALMTTGCDVDAVEEPENVDERPAIDEFNNQFLRFQDDFTSDDNANCADHPIGVVPTEVAEQSPGMEEGSLAPGSDIDTVELVSNCEDCDNVVYYPSSAGLLNDLAEACPGLNDFADASMAIGPPDNQFVSLNGGDLTVGFDVPIRQGDTVNVWEVDAYQVGEPSERIQAVQKCAGLNGLCAPIDEFVNLESKSGAPIVLDFF